MTDMDHQIWNLVTNVISTMLGEGKKEEEILKEVMAITHGIADYNAIRREIVRQKRMTVN